MATARLLKSGNYFVRAYNKYEKRYVGFTAPSKAEAESLASEYVKRLKRTRVLEDKTLCIKDIVQRYINERSNIVSPATIDKYQRTLDNQFSEEFKSIKVKDIEEVDVINEANRLSGIYSPKSVKCAIHLVIPIIRQHRTDLLLNNIRLPKVYQKQKIYPTPQEIIDAFKDDRMELEVLLALCYGMRKEEIRGLMFDDIVKGKAHIRRVKIDIKKETVVRDNAAKTVNSLRSITLSKYVLDLIDQRKQNSIDGYVTPFTGHAIYCHFKKIISKLGYNITFHDLRHINASVMLYLGVPDKYAMERGGWATDSTLKNIYQSTFSDQRKRFDQVIDGFFENLYNN